MFFPLKVCSSPKWNNSKYNISSVQFRSVAQSCPTLCNPMDCSMPGFPVHHQLLELLKLMSIELVMPSNHFILCHPLLLPSIFPSIRVFSNESVLCICCFLTCIQISQGAHQVVWYSHILKNFPQFVVVQTVKGFGIDNK